MWRGQLSLRSSPLPDDLQVPAGIAEGRRTGVHYIQSDSSAIPLANSSVDAVVCHNTLEHFPNYKETLSEVARVLRPSGWLWIAIPNGFGFDDGLYRLVFEGGGHVNRFSFDQLVSEVRQITGMELAQTCDFFSCFIYLKKPIGRDASSYYPRTARSLVNVPEGTLTAAVLALNTVTRIIDKIAGTRYSLYGWGFLFSREAMAREPMRSYFNVCRQCGSGCSAIELKRRTGQTYLCPHCGTLNLFVAPPPGLD
jgi:SAM-dependent methyltransferase